MQVNSPLVSICIPTYNGEEFMLQCIQSAISQTYSNIEILIVDDGSTDKTIDIVNQFKVDNRVVIHRNVRNLGLVANWNKCLELAKGEWIKFLFQDDYLDSNCIEVMMKSVEEGDKLISCKRRILLDERLDESVKRYSEYETITFEMLGVKSNVAITIFPQAISAFAVSNICMNFIGEPTVVMFKKDVIKNVGLFNADVAQICDLEYFLRIGTKYGVKYIPEPLTYFRVHKTSASWSNKIDKLFAYEHLDNIITVHQLLYDNGYTKFRESLSYRQRTKLKLFFHTRVYEAYETAKKAGDEYMQQFERVGTKYPGIAKYKNGSFFINLILPIIKIRRSLNGRSGQQRR